MGKNPALNQDKKHIFLSYRSSEVEFALRLAVDLKNAGVNLWMDRLDIAPGDDWLKMLQKGVNDCSAMICVLSPEYVNSKYCQRELARADRMERMIIPVLLHSIAEGDWPLEIERQQYISFMDWRDDKVYQDRVKKLISILQGRLADQVFSVPDPETRYINTLIAELEAGRGMVEYFEPTVAGGNPNREVPLRPEPIFVKTWNMRGRYALVGDSLGEDKHANGAAPKTVVVNGIYEVVESHPRLILLGGPGSGKTTTLEHLVLDAAHLYRTAPNVAPLPLYLKLVNWGKENSPADFVKANWHLDSDPIKLLSKGKIALYLDGLNEMGAEGLTKVKLLRKWLQSQHAPQRVVLTCRDSDYDANLNLGIPVLRTIDLDRSHVQQFVSNYLNEDDANNFLLQLFPTADPNRPIAPYLYEMVRNPFLLSALIVIYDLSPNHEIPRNTGTLIQRLVTELWARKEKELDGGKSPFKRLEAGLIDLAFAMIDSDLRVFVPLEYAMEYIGSQALLNQAVAANLLEVEEQLVRFSNQLIQEYFAALGLMRAGLSSRLTKPTFDTSIQRIVTKWDMVLQILVGLVSDPDATILEIAKVDPYLALQCGLKAVQVQEATFESVVNQLLATMEGDRRVAMASLFIGVDDEKALFILLEAMRDGIWPVRLAATSALKKIQLPLLPGLTQAIDDLEEKTREETLTALRQIGKDAIPTLLQLVRDSNWHRRRGAAWALGELRDQAAVPLLIELMFDTDYLVCAEAALALGRIKDNVAVPNLVTALGHENWRVGKAASKALALIGKPSVPSLLEVVHATNSLVRSQIHALEALAQIKDTGGLQALLNATYAQSAEIRAAALDGLRYQPSDEAVKRLTECLSDTTKLRQGKRRICDIAAEALEAVGTKEATAAVEQWRKTDARSQSGNFPMSNRKKGKERLERDKDGAASEASLDPVEALKHADWVVRRDTVLGLAALSPTVALPRLTFAIRDEDTQVRLSAIQILALMKDEPRALPVLLEALADEEYLVSDAAREALKKLAKPPSPELRELVHSTNINARGAAIAILGSIQDVDAVQDIVDCLADIRRPWLSDQRICDIAANALGMIGTPESLKAVKQWKAAFKRSTTTTTAVVTDDKPADENRRDILADLITALHDNDWATRQNAAKSLGGYAQLIRGGADASTVERLINLLSDQDVTVRFAVAEALAWIGNQAAVPPLIDLLKDSNWTVKIAAIRALAEIKKPAAVESLIKCLTDKSEMVREAAAEALGNLEDRRALAGLLKALSDSERFVRLAAIDALGKIKGPEAVQPLSKMLRDTDADIRWFSANALGRIANADAVPDLIFCLADTASLSWDEKRICDVAAEALDYIGTPEAKAAVLEWRQATA